jgi:hypothetical protein
MPTWLTITIGYVFAVLAGHFFVSWIVDSLWDEVPWRKSPDLRPAAYVPRLVGLVDRILYVASLQFDAAEFIAVWLALKAAGQWKRWEEDTRVGSRTVPGRFFYGVFLIGTGLSILYAFVGFQVIECLDSQNWSTSIILPLVLILVTIALRCLVWHYQRRSGSSSSVKESSGDA